MLPVFPVYILSLCVSKSIHAGALPGPAYPYFDNHRSTEIHTASWLPGPWTVRTASVFGDSQAMVLDGHDTGMMIPHISPIMDNILLPLTMLSSSCTFPFVSSSKKCRGKGVAGFFPAYAPFVYCDSEVQKKAEKPGEPKPTQPLSSDDAQYAAGMQNKVLKGRLAFKTRKTRVGKKMQQARNSFQGGLNDLGAKTKYQLNINGRGRLCIPPGKLTVMMRMSFADFVFGWGKFLFARSLDALIGAGLALLPPAKKALAGRFDQSAANKLAGEALERASKGNAVDLWNASKQAVVNRQDLYRELMPEIAVKTLIDNVKSLVTDGKVKAPYGLFSYGVGTGQGTYLWWGKIDGTPLPFDFRGLRGPAMDALKGTCYQPAVNELVADNPNYAAAPKQDGGTN